MVSKLKPECSVSKEREIAAGALQDLADAGCGELDDEMPDLDVLRSDHGSEARRRHAAILLCLDAGDGADVNGQRGNQDAGSIFTGPALSPLRMRCQ